MYDSISENGAVQCSAVQCGDMDRMIGITGMENVFVIYPFL